MTNKTLNYYNENSEEFINNTLNVDMVAIHEKFIQKLPENAVIVDAGCGSGRDTLYFKNKGFTVIAFDPSEELVKFASQYTNQEVIQASFKDVPEIIPEGSVDAVWCMASLLHLEEPEIIQALIDLHKVLKPNGTLFASFKYGEGSSEDAKGRFFTYLNSDKLNSIFNNINLYNNIQFDINGDSLNRQDTQWISIYANALPLTNTPKVKF